MIIMNRKDNSLVQELIPTSDMGWIEMTGRYVFDIPDFIKIPIDQSIGISQTDLKNLVQLKMLEQYPTFMGCNFYPLVETTYATDILDTAQNSYLNIQTQEPRYQIGVVPNSCAILGKNTNTSEMNPIGQITTKTITLPTSKDTIMVYWRAFTLRYTHDYFAQYDTPPSVLYDFETNDISVYATQNSSPILGSVYEEASLMTPLTFNSPSTTYRLTFVNNSSNKIHLLAFAILY